MKKLYFLLAAFMLALVSTNAQLVVKWGDPDNYTIETELVDGNYFGENNGVYLWENGSQHQFIKIHGIDKNYLSGQDYNQFYFYIRVTGTQMYSDGQGGTVIGPRVNEDGYPVGIPGFDYYTVCESGEYQGVFYYYNYSEFMVGYTKPNGYYGSTRCNLSSYFNQTDGFSMGSITTGRLVVLQAENGTMAAQWIMGSGNVGAIIGEGGVVSKIDIPLTSDLVYNDNTGADAEWRYLQLSGTGNGSDNNNYNAAFYIKTGFKTGTFTSNDLDLTQTFLKQNGTVVEWSDVTVTVAESSTGVYNLTAVFTGLDGKTYNVTATYEDCPSSTVASDPFVFSNNEELVNSVNVASGSQTTVYYLDWYRDGESGKRPCTRIVFCFYKSDMRYVNGKVYPPDGTYTFSNSTNVPVWSVAGYRWVFGNDGYYSMYYDQNSTKNYLNSGSVTVQTQSDGVYVTVNARGGTGTSSTNRSFNITIVPSLQTAASGYKLDTYVNGRGIVERSSQDCSYQEGNQILLTPTPETGWNFTGWTGTCADQIKDNNNGTYTYTVPANDCSVIANFEEGNSCAYTVHFDSNGGSGTMTDQEFTCGVADNLIPNEFVGPAATITYNYHGATSGDETPSVTVNKPFGVWEDNVVEELHDDEEEINYSVSNGATITMTAQWDGFPRVTLPTPEKTGFTFNGWYTEETGGTLKGTGGANVIIAGDITLHAQWTANGYTVTFLYDDGTELQSGQVQNGEHPVYTGETPVKPQDNYYVYTFSGWSDGTTTYGKDAELPAVTENVTYTAVFTSEQRLFTVHFKNSDSDDDLQTSYLAYGGTPVFDGTPTRENEGDEYNWYEFTFTNWIDSENNTYAAGTQLPSVTQDTVYAAQYSKALYIILQENMDADYYTNFSDKYNGEKATTATLNRQFGQSKWATLCLPFNVPTGLVTSLKMMSRVYEFRYTKGSEAEGMTLYFAQAKSLVAGKGYIVNANAKLAQMESFVFPGVVINTDADINSDYDITNLEGYNSEGSIYLVGTLRTGLLIGSETGNTYMGLKDNKIYTPNATEGTKLRAYRGIFRNAGNEQLPSRVRIVVEGEDGEQVSELEVINGSLEEVAAPKKYFRNGILYIERNGMQFDAQGQRLD